MVEYRHPKSNLRLSVAELIMYARSASMVSQCVREKTLMVRHRHPKTNDSHLAAAAVGIPVPFVAMAPPSAGVRTTGGSPHRQRKTGLHPSAVAGDIHAAFVPTAPPFVGVRSGLARRHRPRNNSYPSAAVGSTPVLSSQTGSRCVGVQASKVVDYRHPRVKHSRPLAAGRNMCAPSVSTGPSCVGVTQVGGS